MPTHKNGGPSLTMIIIVLREVLSFPFDTFWILQCTSLLYQIECPLWSVTTRFGVWRSCRCTQPAGEPQQLFITQVQAHGTHEAHAMPVQIFSIQNKFWPRRRRSPTTIHRSLSKQLSWTWTHAHYGIGKDHACAKSLAHSSLSNINLVFQENQLLTQDNARWDQFACIYMWSITHMVFINCPHGPRSNCPSIFTSRSLKFFKA